MCRGDRTLFFFSLLTGCFCGSSQCGCSVWTSIARSRCKAKRSASSATCFPASIPPATAEVMMVTRYFMYAHTCSRKESCLRERLGSVRCQIRRRSRFSEQRREQVLISESTRHLFTSASRRHSRDGRVVYPLDVVACPQCSSDTMPLRNVVNSLQTSV